MSGWWISLVHLIVILLYMGFGALNNGKGMVPKCTQYVVAKTLLSVTMQLHTTEWLVYTTSLEVQNTNDAVKNHDTVHQCASSLEILKKKTLVIATNHLIVMLIL